MGQRSPDLRARSPAQRLRRRVVRDLRDARNDVLEPLRRAHLRHARTHPGVALLEEVAIARERPRVAAPKVEDLPAEHRSVEGARAVAVARLEIVEVQRTGLVDDRCAAMLL